MRIIKKLIELFRLKEKAVLLDEKKKIQEVGKKLDIDELIQKERAAQTAKVRTDGDAIIKNIAGIDFEFCKEGFGKFEREFCESGWEIDYDINDGYILRRKGSKVEYFHRWLKKDEIDEFMAQKKCREKDVEVHHLNQRKEDNRISNLKVMDAVECRELNKSFQGFIKKN